MSEWTFERPRDEEEREALGAILVQCFHTPDAFWTTYREWLGDDAFRVVREDGRLRGGLGLISMGQWLGGKRLRMAGVAAVGIAPEARGSGAARVQMEAAVRELRESGFALSVLYSAAQRLYRGVGFEAAGNRVRLEVPLASVNVRDRELPVRPADPLDGPDVRDLDRARAREDAGLLDRGAAGWTLITKATQGRVLGYVVGPSEAPEGYVLFRQISPSRPEDDYDLEVRDLVARTPAALRRIWTLLADHRSQAGHVRWFGTTSDPSLLLFPEPVHRVVAHDHWHLRVVDVPAALADRGYPARGEEELHLEVRDDLLPENAGRWRLRVVDGEATVEPGGRGDLRLDPLGLAPLYTGLIPARALARLGRLEGAEASLLAAERLFLGPEPWMPDNF